MSEAERIRWRTILRDAFSVSGMSERAVSAQSGTNRGSLSDILSGKSVPRVATIEALRQVFGLPADIERADSEVESRRARPGGTPTFYWIPEAGSPEVHEPVKWGHMEDRLAEIDARIARIESAVIDLTRTIEGEDAHIIFRAEDDVKIVQPLAEPDPPRSRAQKPTGQRQ